MSILFIHQGENKKKRRKSIMINKEEVRYTKVVTKVSFHLVVKLILIFQSSTWSRHNVYSCYWWEGEGGSDKNLDTWN
jgi:hypothetical protein